MKNMIGLIVIAVGTTPAATFSVPRNFNALGGHTEVERLDNSWTTGGGKQSGGSQTPVWQVVMNRRSWNTERAGLSVSSNSFLPPSSARCSP